jgi:regulator of protease activity HflC (stomatin/prohibitin superfamily)
MAIMEVVGTLVGLGLFILLVFGVFLVMNVRVIQQYERGVIFRLGKVLSHVRGPGLTVLIPFADRLQKVNMQLVTMPLPGQDGITRDNVTVRVDAVLYFRVVEPIRAVVDVHNYTAAIGQVALTSLRSIIGKSNLDELLSTREGLNEGLQVMIDSPALGWGIHIDRVEIKDVTLPDSMKRSMSRQAEAERERRARIITADGELQASEKLATAADVMGAHPAALQLRLLQTVVEVAAEQNSTVVLPFPVELLRFFAQTGSRPSGGPSTNPQAPMTN